MNRLVLQKREKVVDQVISRPFEILEILKILEEKIQMIREG